MELKKMGILGIFISILFLIALPKLALSEFIGPINVIESSLGDTDSEFTLYHDDMGDSVPGLRCVNSSGNMVIPDCVKKQVKIYSSKGMVLSTITPKNVKINYTWPGFVGCDSKNNIYTSNWDKKLQKYSSDGDLLWEKDMHVGAIYVQPDDSVIIWGYRQNMKGKEICIRYSPTGQLLKTYKEKPLELGVVKSSRGAGRTQKYTVKYDDITYTFKSERIDEQGFQRDACLNLYLIGRITNPKDIYIDAEWEGNTVSERPIPHYIVTRYDLCDNSQERLHIPANKSYYKKKAATGVIRDESVLRQYGKPIVAHTGDVYCWKRTAKKYTILKWTWQGPPDAPQSLKVTASKKTISLSWEIPKQDANSVKTYEIYRSSDVCGPFNKIKKVKKDILHYTDKEVKEGETYYYQVCAERGSGYSRYSNKAVGSIKD